MAWSPLAGGRLVKGEGKGERRVRAVLEELGRKYSAELDQIVYAWLLRHPARIIPVLGTQRLDRLTSATGALSLKLDTQDWFAVWSASAGAPLP
jgi:predicted oxidoreductase